MYRREFLKLSGLFSASLVIQVNPLGKVMSPSTEAESQGKLYRGTSDGKIYVSTNAGKAWQLHTDFGSDFSVHNLAANFWGQVNVELGFATHNFDLALMDNGKTWQTV